MKLIIKIFDFLYRVVGIILFGYFALVIGIGIFFDANFARQFLIYSTIAIVLLALLWKYADKLIYLYIRLFHKAKKLNSPQLQSLVTSCNELFRTEINNIYVIQQNKPQAYCLSRGKVGIYVTDYLLNNFTIEECKFVFGHELGHAFTRMLPFGKNYRLTQDEFKADAFGYLVTQNLEAAISVLEKMEQLFESGKFSPSTDYHPSTGQRISALKKIARFQKAQMAGFPYESTPL